jgi:hypothetical protein
VFANFFVPLRGDELFAHAFGLVVVAEAQGEKNTASDLFYYNRF